MIVTVKKSKGFEDFELPKYATEGSVAMDLLAAVDESVYLHEGDRKLISTGISIGLPDGYEAQIRPRSGMALKQGISVLNSPGTIDCVPQDALILMSDGKYNTLKEILARDIKTLLSYNIEREILEEDDILDIWEVGERDTSVLEFDDGTRIEVTDSQLVLTTDGWKEAFFLLEDDEILQIL